MGERERRWWEATACWLVSYTLSVSLRHVSHAYCVFGRHADHPCTALAKTYLTYLSTIVASTTLNLVLVSTLQQTHDVALVITATFPVAWSYFALQCAPGNRRNRAHEPTPRQRLAAFPHFNPLTF